MVRLEEEGDCGKNERKFPVSTRYPEEMEEAWEKTGLPGSQEVLGGGNSQTFIFPIPPKENCHPKELVSQLSRKCQSGYQGLCWDEGVTLKTQPYRWGFGESSIYRALTLCQAPCEAFQLHCTFLNFLSNSVMSMLFYPHIINKEIDA